MKLSEDLSRMERQMEILLKEVRELKSETSKLEKQNMHLRALLYEQKELGEGFENLLRIYHEGFHICPNHFAGAREGEDCIFCLSFLESQKAGK